ncbi:retrovirus-related pol polyprotein from transposon TNT 1-94 [Tanacetum coccineum]
MGVKSTFSNGVLEEEAWYTRIGSYLKKNGNDEQMIEKFKEAMTQEFEITNLGLMKYFLVVTHVAPGTKLSKFEGGDRVDAGKYRSVVGSLRYLTCTRPDIAYSVSVVSQFMKDPRSSHWRAVRIIIQHIKGTQSLGLFYSNSANCKLIRYSDSNWNRNIDDLKSTSGYVFYMGDTSITWASKKQPIVTLSTCEANYVAMSWCARHAIWLRNLLSEINLQQHKPTEIRVYNELAIELARNPIHHERRKHKDVCLYFIREQVRNREVQLTHMATHDQVADIFTKALPAELFNDFKMMLRIKDERDLSFREDFVNDKLKSHSSSKVNGKRVSFNSSLLSFDKNGVGGTKICTIAPYTSLHASIYKWLVKGNVKASALKKIRRVTSVAPFGACFDSRTAPKTTTGPGVPDIDIVLPHWNAYWLDMKLSDSRIKMVELRKW